MRYRIYFLGSSDVTAKAYNQPRAINIGIKKKHINLEFVKKIPMERVQGVTTEYATSDKAFSVAKAGAGFLLAGPLGLLGGALGGRKVKATTTIKYLNDNGELVEARLEGRSAPLIQKKYDKIQQKLSVK